MQMDPLEVQSEVTRKLRMLSIAASNLANSMADQYGAKVALNEDEKKLVRMVTMQMIEAQFEVAMVQRLLHGNNEGFLELADFVGGLVA